LATPYQRVVQRYLDRAAAEHGDPGFSFERRDEYLLEVGEEVATFLQSLIVACNAQRIVELGTSYGFSTIFLAEAARRTGGQLLTFELSSAKQDHARNQLREAGLDQHVDWHCGDAVALLAGIEGGVDFVLIDLWKDLYVPCLEVLHPKLADNAIIAADNMIHPEMARAEAEAYRAAVRSRTDLQSVLLPIGSGIELSCVWR
jgi:predicted O-methyltransferase YrrM